MAKKATKATFDVEAATKELGIKETKSKKLIDQANTSYDGGLRNGPLGDEYMVRADNKIYEGSFMLNGTNTSFACFLAQVFNADGEYLRPCSVPASLITRQYYVGEDKNSEAIPAIDGLTGGSANERFKTDIKIGFVRFDTTLYKADFDENRKRKDKNKKGNCALYGVI